MAKTKKPSRNVSPVSGGKKPSDGNALSNVATSYFQWRLDRLDMGGRWGWGGVTTNDLLVNIIPKLQSFETQTWAQIEGSNNHSVDLDKCIKDASDRLAELDINEDSLFSLRLTGKQRIWGIKDVAILRILWWDPEHEVCPSKKKGT